MRSAQPFCQGDRCDRPIPYAHCSPRNRAVFVRGVRGPRPRGAFNRSDPTDPAAHYSLAWPQKALEIQGELLVSVERKDLRDVLVLHAPGRASPAQEGTLRPGRL
jgi:hypothetical protein